MEQFIFLLVIGFIGLIKWLMEKSAEQRAKQETEERLDRLERSEPSAPPTRAPRPIARPLIDPDEAVRKLREALGLPNESDLPLPSYPMAKPLPMPKFHVEEVKVIPVHELEQRMVEPPQLPLPKKASMPASTRPQRTGPVAGLNLDELLRSREGLRKVILAQEILGTPKGLVF